MTRMDPIDRQAINRRLLAATFKRLAAKIAGAAAGSEPPDAQPERLTALARLFGLSAFESDILALAVGYAADEGLRKALGGPPTFAIALSRLDSPHHAAVAPDGILRRLRLLELEPGPEPLHRPLRVPESVVGFLYGATTLDPALRPYVQPFVGRPGTSQAGVEAAAHALMQATAEASAPHPIVVLRSRDGEAAGAFAAALARSLDLSLFVADAAALVLDAADTEELATRWGRDAALLGAGLLVTADRDDTPQAMRALFRFADRVPGIVMIAGAARIAGHRRPHIHIDVPAPDLEARRALWRTTLVAVPAAEREGLADELAQRHVMGAPAIEAALAEALARVEPVPLRRRLLEACAESGRVRLAELADRVIPKACWNDLVLPEAQHALLRGIVAHARGREQVFGRWGFASKSDRGLGMSALFAGPSGVGKTMAAEVIAGELERDLFRVDLSAVVSKYIGETEKNLERVFDAAEESGAVLLFDESDSLFGRRGEVRDGRDRYANLEVSYLLQRLDAYSGVAVLTSNLKDHIDDAFLRRLRFIVRFPFPDAALREAIWRRTMPEAAPCRDLDWQKLARLQATGGQIRNIALTAAFLAVEASEPITMFYLARAAQMEFAKLDRAPADAEIRGWVE
jgi:hypothetical protein